MILKKTLLRQPIAVYRSPSLPCGGIAQLSLRAKARAERKNAIGLSCFQHKLFRLELHSPYLVCAPQDSPGGCRLAVRTIRLVRKVYCGSRQIKDYRRSVFFSKTFLQKKRRKKMISKQKNCTENINKRCNKCNNREKEERDCIKNMHLIDGWW